ncbi:MAG: hypothetical protein ACXVCY_06605 [Pseudobdellovibrionaceae bacterium]
MNKLISFVLMFSLLALISCTKETVSDVTKRDRDRDRDRSESIFNEFKLTEGTYKGSTDKNDYLLKIQTAWSAPNGNTSVSYPSIVGTLSFYPKMSMQGQNPIIVNMPVVDGNYMDTTKNLTLTISSGDSNTSRMTCKFASAQKLSCNWYTSRGAIGLDFNAVRTAEESQIFRGPGVYDGSIGIFNDDSKIIADFKTALSVGNGSNDRMAQAKIIANFKVIRPDNNVVLLPPSGDGTYDPFTNSLTFNIQDLSGNKLAIVNCTIVSASNLKCSWISNETFDFALQLRNSQVN